MGKTLARKIAVPLIAGALAGSLSFLSGCWAKAEIHFGNEKPAYEKTAEPQKSSSSSNISSQPGEYVRRPTSKNLEDYFLIGRELGSINRPTNSSLGYDSNPSIFYFNSINQSLNDMNQKSAPHEGDLAQSKQVLGAGIAEYQMLKLDSSSKTVDLTLEALQFKSKKDIEDFLNEHKEYLSNKTLFLTDNIVSVITTPSINQLDSLNDNQKTIYQNMVKDYVNRTGAFAIPTGNQAEREELFNRFSKDNAVREKTEGNNAQPNINSNSAPENGPADNRTNELVTMITGRGLENYLLQDNELRFLKLSEENTSYHQLEQGGALMIPYELFNSEFNSNPVRIKKDELEDERIKNFFDESKIEEFEWAAYKIPQREVLSREHNLTLFLFKFKGNEEAKQFLARDEVRFPTFIKGDTMSVIYAPTFDFVYNSGLFSREQQIIYTDLVFDYRDRTGSELVLSNNQKINELRQELLNDLRKRYSWSLKGN